MNDHMQDQKDKLGEWIHECAALGLTRDQVRKLLCKGLTCEWLTEDEDTGE